MDNRGATPVVEKLLMIGIVVLFIGGVTGVLFADAVPGYRDAVGAELGDRVTASAAERIEDTVPPAAAAATARSTVDVPQTIRGEEYRLRADGDTLVLDHPTPAIESHVRLSLPAHVDAVSGTLDSRGEGTVQVRSTDEGVVIALGESP